MSIEIIPDQLSAHQRFLGLYAQLKCEKPQGEELSRLFDEMAEAQKIAFSEIPISRLARNVTPLAERIKQAFRGVVHR